MTLFPDSILLTCVHRTISNVTWINIFYLSGDNIHVTNIWYLIGYLSNIPTTSKLSVCHVQSVYNYNQTHNRNNLQGGADSDNDMKGVTGKYSSKWPCGNHHSDESEQHTIPCFCGIQFFHHICRTSLYYESEVMNDCGLPPPWPE